MEVSVPEVSIRERVRRCLQPHDNGMYFAQCSDQRVVYEKVYHDRGDEEAERDVDPMYPSNQFPC